MKKIMPLLFLILTGCSGIGDVVTLVNPLNFTTTGFYPLLIVGELETNLSSLVIDKTKARVEKFSVNPFEILPERSTIYVMPVMMDDKGKTVYEKQYAKMLENYFMMNGFAVPVKSPEQADYILRADILESPDRAVGKNFSRLQMTIMERNETPVFYTMILIESKSDKNFYYYPSKYARPVKELTLYGLEEILRNGLPQAFGSEKLEV